MSSIIGETGGVFAAAVGGGHRQGKMAQKFMHPPKEFTRYGNMVPSTTGFKNVGVDQVAESMRFKYGFCNPMPETQILAAATFGDPETRQIDNIKTESVCYGGIFSCADFLSSDDTGVC